MDLIRRIVILSAACAFFVPAVATAAGDYDRFGVYVGIDAAWGYPLFEDQIRSATMDPTASADYTWGLNARLGLRALSFLAVEAQYEWMDKFSVEALGGSADIRGNTLTGNLKFYLPVWRIEPYVLAGLGVTWYKLDLGGAGSQTQSYFAGRLGGGADFYLTEKVAINAEVTALLTSTDLQIGTDSLNSLHYLSVGLGLMYRF